MTTFGEKFKQDAKENNISSSDWFKFQEGDNIIRILVEPEILFEKYKVGICFTGCNYEGTPKYMTYILDRKDGKIKPTKLPYIIAKNIATYSQDEDYHFEQYPMPYDIKVNAVGAGSKEVKYTVMPKPAKEVEAGIIEQIEKLTPISKIIEKMKEKQKEKIKNNPDLVPKQETQRVVDEENVIEYPEEDNNLEDIPF